MFKILGVLALILLAVGVYADQTLDLGLGMGMTPGSGSGGSFPAGPSNFSFKDTGGGVFKDTGGGVFKDY